MAKKKAKEDAQLRRTEEETARQTRRQQMGESEIFSGSLSSKKKADLQDIAHALHLPMDKTNAELIASIGDHLKTHPELQDNPRFTGLFLRRGQKRSAPENDENEPPPIRRRIELSTSTMPVAGPSNTHPFIANTFQATPQPLHDLRLNPFQHPSSSLAQIYDQHPDNVHTRTNSLSYNSPYYPHQYPSRIYSEAIPPPQFYSLDNRRP